MKHLLLLLFLIQFINCNNDDIDSTSSSSSTTTTSYDSLISSQCKARCLSLYPWKLPNNTIDRRNRDMQSSSYNSRRYQRHNNNISFESNGNNHHNVKWHKVMELCSKNTNCLQCSLPCDIPTNLLPNCKYLCKQQHPLCIESCNLLLKLNQEKYGSCPSIQKNYQLLSSSSSSENKCNNISKQTLLLQNKQQDDEPVNECSKDSDCNDVQKCCQLNPECPEHGSVCKKPTISNLNLPSIPFNLTITERKKGKTVILSWDCIYNKNKPTMFVVEGRWSLKSPHLTARSLNQPQNDNTMMTKWGYLAQTTNNNWIILRSINRGRWYKFRVAAISKSGTYGYSQPTELFILSSPPKPPSQPQNLTIQNIHKSSENENRVDVDLSWLPSKRSDLPISNYKITWKLSSNSDLNFNNNNQNNEDNTDDQDASSNEDNYNHQMEEENTLSQQIVKTPEYGLDLINSAMNKYTLKNLNKNTKYVVELVAVSKYEKNLLSSPSIKIKLDTSNYNNVVVGSEYSSLKSSFKPSKQDYEEEDEEEEDDDLDNTSNIQQEPIVEQKPIIPIIKNLSIHMPYFQNGLVKAKITWLAEPEEKESTTNSNDQPMYTITWFPIKCIKMNDQQETVVTLAQKQLPTPITATTISTNFEIYELKYNCDYVVNVKLANINRPLADSASVSSNSISKSSSLLNQISSAQFKVPPCSSIRIIGRIRPTCYESRLSQLSNKIAEPYSFEFDTTPSITPIYTTTKSLTESIITTTISSPSLIKFSKNHRTTSTFGLQLNLPRVYHIKHKIIDKDNQQNIYSVEFTWSISMQYLASNNPNFHGYQISVVPKAIPGLIDTNSDMNNNNNNNNNNNFGSVGAIVQKDQLSFVVKNLRSSTRYIFQIQSIGRDNQYGMPSTLEFVIEEQQQTRKLDYDLDKSDIVADLEPLSSASSDDLTSDLSSSIYQNNSINLKYNFKLITLFIIIFTILLNFW